MEGNAAPRFPLPGGKYESGAQEEGMFVRTNCHFALSKEVMNEDRTGYTEEVETLLQGTNGEVYLDDVYPRVCTRGPESHMKDHRDV